MEDRFLPLKSLEGAYVFYDNKFWQIVKIDGGIQMKECNMAEVPLSLAIPGYIIQMQEQNK